MITFKNLGKKGRLGNQMWQLSATIAHARNNNNTPLFPINTKKFFIHWNIPDSFFGNVPNHPTYNEPNFHYNEIPYRPNQNLEGYFQSYKYFKNQENYIREIFTPQNTKYKNEVLGKTAIHVRRGDYLQWPQHHPVLPMEYYEDAMVEMNTEQFLIFSDDISWCKANFRHLNKQYNIEYSEGHGTHEDLIKMMYCDNQIIANSSYSWWGGWLNPNENKKVIAPKKWFGPVLSNTHNTKDLYPEGWLVR